MATGAAGTKQHAAVGDHRPGMDSIFLLLLLRNGFAGQHRLIKPGFALDDLAINRNPIAGGQAQGHARMNLGKGNNLFPGIGHYSGGGWGEIEQALQRFR